MNKKFYITTPIYYPNAKPHIGSVYSTLLADFISRYQMSLGQEVVFLTGLDEHGQKVHDAAQKAGVETQRYVDTLSESFQSIFRAWNIGYTIFMRTTSQFHIQAVQEWIGILQKKNFIYKSTYSGWYSTSSESFLLEKDIENKNAEGVPLCPITQAPAMWVSEEAYFFKLSFFEEKLLNFFSSHPHFITPKERTEEIISFIKTGLRDLCISRSKKNLSWGIPFPGDDEHVVYVWADALNNYITGVGYLQDEAAFNLTWPADIQIMAKDIIRFHAVYWLAFLMAAEVPLPRRELVHGWLLFEDQKMSKSLGNVVDPEALIQKYDVDSIRYYLSTLSLKDDSNFSEEDIVKKHNSDLCDNISNLFQRMKILALKKGLSLLDDCSHFLDQEIVREVESLKNKIEEFLETGNIPRIAAECMIFGNYLNSFFHNATPWKITEIDSFKKIICSICYGLHALSVYLLPIMPKKMSFLLESLGVEQSLWAIVNFNSTKTYSYRLLESHAGYVFTKIEVITKQSDTENVPLINVCKKEELKNVVGGPNYEYVSFDEFAKNIILVGKITSVDDIPKSSKLYYLTVDFGSYGLKKIASGIKEHYQKNELLGIKTIFAFNIPPRSLCGVTSEGMILMATNTQGKPELTKISELVEVGARLK